jgi:hypothetical protein
MSNQKVYTLAQLLGFHAVPVNVCLDLRYSSPLARVVVSDFCGTTLRAYGASGVEYDELVVPGFISQRQSSVQCGGNAIGDALLAATNRNEEDVQKSEFRHQLDVTPSHS